MGASLLLFSWLPTSPKGIINELQLKAPCCLWNGPWQTNYMSTPRLHTFVSSPFPPRSVWWNIHLPTERYFLHLSNCFKKDRLKLISHRHFSGGVPSFSQWVTYGVGAMEFIPAHLSWLSLQCEPSSNMHPALRAYRSAHPGHDTLGARLSIHFPGIQYGLFSAAEGSCCIREVTYLSSPSPCLRLLWFFSIRGSFDCVPSFFSVCQPPWDLLCLSHSDSEPHKECWSDLSEQL